MDMDNFIEQIKRLVADIENERDFNKRLDIIDDLCDVCCDFYNEVLDTESN